MAYADFFSETVDRSPAFRWPARRFVPPRLAPQPYHAFLPSHSSACPEIDCIRDLLPARLIAAAERRAAAIGLSADRVLIAGDAITEDAYLAAFGRSLGIPYVYLEDVPRTVCPLDDDQLIEAAAAGLLPLREDGGIRWVIAPRCLAARRLSTLLRGRPELLATFRLTSSEQLERFVQRYAWDAIGRHASDGLHRSHPLLSSTPHPPRYVAVAAILLISLACIAAFPAIAIVTITLAASLVFLAAAALRLSTVLIPGPRRPPTVLTADDGLPIYTVICALYHEANVVEGLVAAIRRLDWPIEKLDVKFVLEPDDVETRHALVELELGSSFEILTAPDVGPRTKPKALNTALLFARGTFTVIYDAEDLPEPDQLRRAFDAFMGADDNLACVQARLTIDNTADSWLARMFTADYAGQFDVFLPGLAALDLPLPLGGSSNHFRTALLRKAGGWDAYNVTEDADLGMRLALLGYRSTTIVSSTYEEAPAAFGPWLRQRTRWYKGWMQTWCVHMRTPGRLLRDLGSAGAISFQLVIGGNVLAALLHPIFLLGLVYAVVRHHFGLSGITNAETLLFIATSLSGYAATIAPGTLGLHRRKLARHAWIFALVPLHWLLLSLAAWRALLQVMRDPYSWEKTAHGLARTSRLQQSM